jgi:hypothetical protein
MGSILALLEASSQRRSIAAEAFRATLAGLTGVHVQVEPINPAARRHAGRREPARAAQDLHKTVRSTVEGFVQECRLATAEHAG